jgi:PAS domain S-box-containing protein
MSAVDELLSESEAPASHAAGTLAIVWHAAPDGSVLRASPSWHAFTGQSLQQYRGWGWLDAVHPEDREAVASAWRAASADPVQYETSYRLRNARGEYRVVNVQGTPVTHAGKLLEWVGVCVDVTASRAAEQALRESEWRLRFLDRLGQATRSLTDPGEVMRVSTRMLGEYIGATRCAYADVGPDGDEFTIRSDWTMPGVASTVGTYSLALFGPRASSQLHRGEHLIVRDVDAELGPDGGARMFNAIGIKAIICAGLVKEGRLVAMMAVHQAHPRTWTQREIALVGEVVNRCWMHIEWVHDIAEGRRALLKLEMGIQAADLVMAEIDYRTNENHLSAQLARLLELGDGPMTVPRQAIFDRIHPDDRDRYLKAIGRTVDPAGTGLLAITVRALLPSGAQRWVHIRLKVTFAMIDGRMQPERGICAARDVTAEVSAERKLHEAQRLAESVMENAGALVYVKDLEGRYLMSNNAWRTVLGRLDRPVVGLTDFELLDEKAARRQREVDRQVIDSGRSVTIEEKLELAGRPATYRSSKFPLYDDTGKIYAVCGVATDISDVVEADRRKDEFIATLAHELRNPLAPIRNGLEILRLTPGLPVAAARVRDVMDRQLVHLVRLVDDLLDVSRITRDKLEIRLVPTTLKEIVEHAVEASRPAVESAGHRLAIELPGEEVPITGDLTRLAQVVSNLLNNAAKYTPAGGRVELRAQVQDAALVVQVSDTGVGLDAEMLPRAFTLFAQSQRVSRAADGGLGIGLWLVKKLVELHHGTVEAASAGPGQGSTFTVRLPLDPAVTPSGYRPP